MSKAEKGYPQKEKLILKVKIGSSTQADMFNMMINTFLDVWKNQHRNNDYSIERTIEED